MISVRMFNAHPRRPIRTSSTSRLVRRVLRGEQIRDADVSVVFINDRTMLKLNTDFLNHRYQTDVLTFPLSEDRSRIEGEVYVNTDQANRQAREYGVTIKNEVARLVVHGVLHLVGYTDKTKADRQTMTLLENRYITSTK